MDYATEEIAMDDGAAVVLHRWLPEGDARAVVLLSHGMAEHASRYARLGGLLAERGIALYAEDHRGHGMTARLAQERGAGGYGYLGERDGFFRVTDDIRAEALLLRERHPGRKVILLGHSFGSFVAQCLIERYGQDVDGCILCGTAGPRRALMACARAAGAAVRAVQGSRAPSRLLNWLAFGTYNRRISRPRTPFDWLSRDAAQVDAYMADRECGFLCTAGFFCDLFAGLSYIHRKEHIAAVPRLLPVLLVAGTDDPVGDYGKTVSALYGAYRSGGMADVRLILYPQARHELFNEANREEVERDVLAWLECHC